MSKKETEDDYNRNYFVYISHVIKNELDETVPEVVKSRFMLSCLDEIIDRELYYSLEPDIKSLSAPLLLGMFPNIKLSPSCIENLLNHSNPYVRAAIIGRKGVNISETMLKKLSKDYSPLVRCLTEQYINSKTDPENENGNKRFDVLDQAINTVELDVLSFFQFTKFDDSIVEKGLTSRDKGVRLFFHQMPKIKLTENQIDRAFRDCSSVRAIVVERDDVHLSESQIESIIKAKGGCSKLELLKKKDVVLSDAQIDYVIDNHEEDSLLVSKFKAYKLNLKNERDLIRAQEEIDKSVGNIDEEGVWLSAAKSNATQRKGRNFKKECQIMTTEPPDTNSFRLKEGDVDAVVYGVINRYR